MTDAKIKVLCNRCLGTGIDNNISPPSSCFPCGGTGYVTKDVIDVTVLHKGNITRCPISVILENTDSDEYTALDANKKAWYNLFISAGTLDMTEGTKPWDLFLSWIFPAGKTSHTTILAALSAL